MAAVLFTIEYRRLFCYPLTNGKPINSTLFLSFFPLLFLNLLLVADAYCLLDVYSVLSRNPAYFGLPADLRSISSSHSEKSGDKKKEKPSQAKQSKQALGREVRGQLLFFIAIDIIVKVYLLLHCCWHQMFIMWQFLHVNMSIAFFFYFPIFLHRCQTDVLRDWQVEIRTRCFH